MMLRAHPAVIMLAVLAGCRGGTVDLHVTSSTPATLTQLTLTLDDGARSEVHTYTADGGLPLPQSLRVLADGPRLGVTALAFDTEGKTRAQQAQVAVETGKTVSATLDLSDAGWCPAAPPEDGVVVLYDEGPHGRDIFGFQQGRIHNSNDPATACTGTMTEEYTVNNQYDGLGLYTETPARYSRLSMRLWVSEPSGWDLSVANAGTAYVLPTPAACAGSQDTCQLNLGPTWQLVSFDVPASVPATTNIQLQLNTVIAHPVTVRIDDVRVWP